MIGAFNSIELKFVMNELTAKFCISYFKTLENHYQHTIALEAKKIEHPLQPDEIDLSDLLETSTDTVSLHKGIAHEFKKKTLPKIPVLS